MQISKNEQDYIKSIFKLQADVSVSTTALSEHLHLKAASITDMLKKLADKKLVSYKKYQGVTLSTKGEKLALELIRKHRLWEVFLVEKLNYKWDEVHAIAEQLEHVEGLDLINRLDKFLGLPKFDPHGDPIPNEKLVLTKQNLSQLGKITKPGKYQVSMVNQDNPSFLQYLTKLSIKIGDIIKLHELITFDGSLNISINNSTSIFMSNTVANGIYVYKLNN